MLQDRPTKLVVNLSNIVENYNSIKSIIKDKEVMAIVKADAYGHGVRPVVEALSQNGANHFGVATLEEALEVRSFLKNGTILVLGATNPKNVIYAVEKNISLCCPSYSWLEQVQGQLNNIGHKLKIHLKIDSGMSRIGISTEEEARKVNKILMNTNNIELEGIFTHYSSADEKIDDFDYYQREKFESLVRNITLKPKYLHHENSAATLKYFNKDFNFNLARVGISLYGSYPSSDIENRTKVKLKTVSSLISKVVHIKKLDKGTKVGYGCTYETIEDEYIATIPIGYRDGLLRYAQGWKVLVNGEKCEIVGRICMDQLMIKCSKNVIIGDTVLFYGEYKDNKLPVEQYADYMKTIPYEVYCVIGERVPRIYKVIEMEK